MNCIAVNISKMWGDDGRSSNLCSVKKWKEKGESDDDTKRSRSSREGKK